MLAPMFPARFALACACLLSCTCRRDTAAQASDAAPSGIALLSPTPISIRIAAVEKDRTHVTVALVAPEIGLAEPIFDLAFPWTCQGAIGGDDAYRVTCTPDVVRPVLVASIDRDSLVLTAQGGIDAGAAKRFGLPVGALSRFENASVSSRAVEPIRCDDDAPLRTVDLAPAVRGRRIELEAPGTAAPFPIAMLASGPSPCTTLVHEGVSMRLRCGEGGPDCSLSATDTAIHFDCTKPSLYSGMVLVSCGLRARFRKD
jgi:hypothetical protein